MVFTIASSASTASAELSGGASIRFPSGFSPTFDQGVGPRSFFAQPDTVPSAAGESPGGIHLGSEGDQQGWLGPWRPDRRGRFDHGGQRGTQDHRAPRHGRELPRDAPTQARRAESTL